MSIMYKPYAHRGVQVGMDACMYVNIPKVNKYNLFAHFYKAVRSVHIINLSANTICHLCVCIQSKTVLK